MRGNNSGTEHTRDPLDLRAILRSTTALTGLALAVALMAGTARADDWTGATSSDWFTDTNWGDGTAPTTADDVRLNTVTPNPTVINGSDAQVDGVNVGYVTGTGALTIENGGTLTNINADIARNSTAQGAVLVTGTGSQWSGNTLSVGQRGIGTLTIENGGRVDYVTSYIGTSFGSHGTVTVTGDGSQLVNDWGGTKVAVSGTGVLNIENRGAVITNGNAQIGIFADGVGMANVTGNGSRWTIAGDLEVGYQGTGTLTIDQGAVVSNSATMVGEDSGSTGTLNLNGVSGARGVLETNTISTTAGTASIVFDGGILRARSNQPGLIGAGFAPGDITIAAGGAYIDTNGWDVGFQSPLSGPGELVKQGEGNLILFTPNTHGSTRVSEGGLAVYGPTASITHTTGSMILGDQAGTLADLQIGNGGVVESGSTRIGEVAGANSEGVVIDSGSKWVTHDLFIVGNSGRGVLTIANGGLVESLDKAHIGRNPGSLGGVVVTGAGPGGPGTTISRWTVADELVAGYQGEGRMKIEAGGTVSNTHGYIGYQADGIGDVMVTGSGATWTNNGVVEVGFNGTGTLTVEDGGVVTGTFGYVGALSGSHGTATVTGANSKWTSSESLAVGHTGTGSLTIGAGGTVENTYAYIGYNPASAPSTVTVTGTDSTGTASTWKNSGNLTIGRAGDGVLRIEAGGAVTNTFGVLGADTGSHGTATVTGTGSIWTNSDSMIVGQQGTGSLTIADGGTVADTHGTLGSSAGSHGTATVTGEGSKWANAGTLTVGYAGIGSLAIEDHGTVTNTDGYIGYEAASAPGIVTVTGTGSTWTNSGFLSLGWHGSGSLTVSGGGKLKSAGAFIGHLTGEGDVAVTGAGSRWDASAAISVGLGGKGALTVADEAVIASSNIYIAASASSEGVVNIGAAAGDAAFAAGTLDTSQVTFGNGDGKLVFNHTQTATNYLFAPRIVGTGQIDVLAGTTELNDAGGFSGSTSVGGGATLVANGTLGGTLDVLTGGLLKGSGTVGSANIAGTIAPGNSIGTLSTTGPLTFASGSTYEVEVNDAGGSDRIAVTGGVTIDPGATVTVLPENGTDDGSTYVPETSYTILTATTGRTGMFDPTVSEGFAFLDATLSYDPNSAFLKLTRNSLGFASLGETPNQRATAGAVDSMGSGATLYDAAVTLTAPQALAAFDTLSGEVHASAKSMLIEDSRFVREAVDARLRAAFAGVGARTMPVLAYGDDGPEAAPADTGRFAAWGHAFGSWGEWDGDGNAAALTRDTGGFVLGGDMAVADIWRLGLLAGYSSTRFDIDDRASSGSAESYHLGAYAGTEIGKWGLRFGGAWSWHAIDTARTAAFAGFTDHLEADYDAATAQLFAEAGYRIDTAHVSFEPFANLAYVNLHTDGFTETGGPAALSASSSSNDTAFTTLGLRAGTALPLGGMTARLHGMLGWRHAFGDITPTSGLAFAGGDVFTIAGVPIAEDAAVIEAGLDLALSPNANLGIAYNGQIGSGASDHGLKARFTMTF